MSKPNEFNDAVSSTEGELFSHKVKDIYRDQLLHESTRKRIKEVVEDHVNSVLFMKKVREYAGMEIDSRMFRSVQHWGVVILSSFITSSIAIIISSLFS